MQPGPFAFLLVPKPLTTYECKVATHPKARRSILDMRRTFVRYQDHLSSIAIVAEKIA